MSTIAIGVGLLVETQQTDVKLTWNLQRPAAASTSLPTPSAQPSPSGSEGVAVVVVPGLAAVMLLVGVYFQLA